MQHSAPHVLAIDLGTSGCKAAVVSLEGRVAGSARVPVPTIRLPGDGAEQDPEAVWSAVKAACRGALGSAQVPPAEVQAVICASQYSSVVPLDAHGRPTMNMLLWQDQRGVTARLRRLPGFPRGTDGPLAMLDWLRIHGLPPVGGGIALTHLRFVKFARPEVYARTATFLEPADFVTSRLAGRAVANQCTAFMFLLTDNRRLGVTEYDARLLRHSLIDRDKLPELVPADAIVGTVRPELAEELGLAPGTRVVTGLNDTQAGGLGAGAFVGAHAGISVGSTSVMITHVPGKRTDLRRGLLSMPSPVPGTWFVMAENGTGGGALEHFLSRVVYPDDAFGAADGADRYRRLEHAVAATAPGSGGVLFLPWLSGSMAPRADHRMRGGFLNVGLGTTREQLARAVLEGVALNLRWLRGAVEGFTRRSIPHFVLYGGAAASDAWSQVLADVLDAPVRQAQDPDFVVARGAALLAFQRLGVLGFDDIAQRVPVRRTFEPCPANRTLYARLSERFEQAFHRTRPLFRALNATEDRR